MSSRVHASRDVIRVDGWTARDRVFVTGSLTTLLIAWCWAGLGAPNSLDSAFAGIMRLAGGGPLIWLIVIGPLLIIGHHAVSTSHGGDIRFFFDRSNRIIRRNDQVIASFGDVDRIDVHTRMSGFLPVPSSHSLALVLADGRLVPLTDGGKLLTGWKDVMDIAHTLSECLSVPVSRTVNGKVVVSDYKLLSRPTARK